MPSVGDGRPCVTRPTCFVPSITALPAAGIVAEQVSPSRQDRRSLFRSASRPMNSPLSISMKWASPASKGVIVGSMSERLSRMPPAFHTPDVHRAGGGEFHSVRRAALHQVIPERNVIGRIGVAVDLEAELVRVARARDIHPLPAEVEIA